MGWKKQAENLPQDFDVTKAPQQMLDRYPLQWTFNFPLHMWGHGGNTDLPIPLYDASTNKYALLGWLLLQSGITRDELNPALADGDPYEAHWHLMRSRYLRGTRNRDDLMQEVNRTGLSADIHRYVNVTTPLCLTNRRKSPDGVFFSTKMVPKLHLVLGVNAQRKALNANGKIVDFTFEDRVFWSREILRTMGIGLRTTV